jgi:hypothetical protein
MGTFASRYPYIKDSVEVFLKTLRFRYGIGFRSRYQEIMD